MKRDVLGGAAVALLLLSGCTGGGDARAGATSPAKGQASSSPTGGAAAPVEQGPAEPVGAAAFTPKDAKLFAALEEFTDETPTDPAHVAVLRRLEPAGQGDLVWMPDSRTYCVASIATDVQSRSCFDLDVGEPARVHVGHGEPRGLDAEEVLVVAVVENAEGPFDYRSVKTGDGISPVRQATMRFPSGRTFTFIAYGLGDGRRSIPLSADICDPDGDMCFAAFDATVPPLATVTRTP
jgi:hypothetical protein